MEDNVGIDCNTFNLGAMNAQIAEAENRYRGPKDPRHIVSFALVTEVLAKDVDEALAKVREALMAAGVQLHIEQKDGDWEIGQWCEDYERHAVWDDSIEVDNSSYPSYQAAAYDPWLQGGPVKRPFPSPSNEEACGWALWCRKQHDRRIVPHCREYLAWRCKQCQEARRHRPGLEPTASGFPSPVDTKTKNLGLPEAPRKPDGLPFCLTKHSIVSASPNAGWCSSCTSKTECKAGEDAGRERREAVTPTA